jgi:hypothetical protein
MINPWEEKFQKKKLIKQLQSLSGAIAQIDYMSNQLFAMRGRLSRLLNTIYLEANTNKDSFFLGGFVREKEQDRKEQDQKDYDRAVEFLNSPHERGYIDKDTFLKMCSDIYDQKEVEYVDKDNINDLGITDKQVRRFLAYKKRKGVMP